VRLLELKQEEVTDGGSVIMEIENRFGLKETN
jgi:hypothetical protein